MNKLNKHKKMDTELLSVFLRYISDDFVFNLFYMMMHKCFIRYFFMDYHRVFYLIEIIKELNPPLSPRKLKERVNVLFGGIETETEVLKFFRRLGYNAVIEDDKIIVKTNNSFDDVYNPNYLEQEEYILPHYILKNFLLFRSAVIGCIMGKFPNDLDYWLYACCYLLMDNKDFYSFRLNPDIFPHIR